MWKKPLKEKTMDMRVNAKEKMKKFGVTAFLAKPVELDTILKTVERFS